MSLFNKYISVIITLFFILNYNLSAQILKSSNLDFNSETVTEQLKTALENEKLSEDNKNTLKELAKQTQANLKSIDSWREKIDSYEKTITSTPEKIKEYKNNPPVPKDKFDFQNSSIISLEQYKNDLEKELNRTTQKQKLLLQEINKRSERRISIPREILDIKAELNQLKEELSTISNKETQDDVSEMRSMMLKAEIQSLKKEIEAYEKELSMYTVTVNLIPLKQDFFNKKSQYLKETISLLNKKLTEKRTEEVEELANKTKTQTPVHPVLKELAEKNQELAAQLTGSDGIVHKLDSITTESDKVMKYLKDVDKLFSDIKNKVQATGMTPALGLYMRNKKDFYSNLDFYIEDRRTLMAEVQTQLLQLEDERSQLSDSEDVIKLLLDKYDGKWDIKERTEVAESARDVIDLRLDLLDKMIKNLNLYFNELVELDTHQRLLISKIEDFKTYVDEYLIWYRSVPRLKLDDFQSGWHFTTFLFDSQDWDEAAGRIVNDFKKETFLYGIVLILILLLIFFHKKLKNSIKTLSESVKNYETDSLGATFKGILFSLLSIFPLPALFIFIGWRLNIGIGGSLFINGLAKGFLHCGFILLALKTTAVFCKEDGVGDIHFKWNSDSLALVNKHLRWFTPIMILMIFLGALVSSIPTENLTMGKAFHRIVFIMRMFLITVFILLVINPYKGPVRRFLDKRKNSIAERLQYCWYLPGIIYISLAILAMLGYFYTAQQFDLRLQESFLLFMLMSFVYGLSSRWMIYIRRKLALERVRKKQKAEKAENDGDESVNENTEAPVFEESLYSMGQDTKKMLAVFVFIISIMLLWWIWQDLFPAFNMFDRINLWSTTQALSETVENTTGADTVKTIQKITSVTLADLMLSIIIVFLTFIIFRNISGIVQMLILQHIKIDQGTRFAIITITKYAIVLIGILFACAYIGLSWSKVQWLVAAVSVGLGFGLQEIFANFISGLIILLEQPIRVGDVVTVGEITGSVSQIKIRATTITDWNKKELIVPNKEFITNRLVNWSLSDKVIRLTIPVGIAYGSDTEKAEKVLYKVAEDQKDVLEEPAPKVLFDEFGESSLTFELRVFVPSFDYYIQIKHDLHMKIDTAFRKAGIEIAFPQRDIHIRSIDAPLKMPKG